MINFDNIASKWSMEISVKITKEIMKQLDMEDDSVEKAVSRAYVVGLADAMRDLRKAEEEYRKQRGISGD